MTILFSDINLKTVKGRVSGCVCALYDKNGDEIIFQIPSGRLAFDVEVRSGDYSSKYCCALLNYPEDHEISNWYDRFHSVLEKEAKCEIARALVYRCGSHQLRIKIPFSGDEPRLPIFSAFGKECEPSQLCAGARVAFIVAARHVYVREGVGYLKLEAVQACAMSVQKNFKEFAFDTSHLI
jgi:hypothetical protein